MKKIFITFVITMMTGLCAMSQNTLMATLDHEGQKSVFFGTNAIQQANDAAATGDIITLSGGTFSSATLTKAVTLRGTGVYANDEAQLYPTIINGNLYLNIVDTEHQLLIEGLKITDHLYLNRNISKPHIRKCIINRIYNYTISNGIFENCYIKGYIACYLSCTFLNCYINDPNNWGYNNNRYEFFNCVIKAMNTNTEYSHFSHCIFLNTGALRATNVVYNCLAVGTGASNVYNNLNNVGQNYYVEDITTIFKEYDGTNYTDNITFELTDEAARTYVCPDGTQIGMYGGSCPFDFGMAALRLTKCVVSNRATEDGTINVDLEVKGVH